VKSAPVSAENDKLQLALMKAEDGRTASRIELSLISLPETKQAVSLQVNVHRLFYFGYGAAWVTGICRYQ